MLGIILPSIGTFFEELGTLVGRAKVKLHKENLYTMGFLNLFWASVGFAVIALIKPGSFVFSWASLSTFAPRLLLEVAQAHITLRAIVTAPRSSFGFIRSLTIVFLLVVDMALGYHIGTLKILGMIIITITLLILFMNHGIERKGLSLTLFTALNAVATFSLFKYDITHYNSVVGEQLVILLVLLVYFFCAARFIKKQNPLLLLKKPIYFLQSLSMGIGSSVESFAFLFAPASVISAAKRSSAVLWSIISGNMYFHEKHFLLKIGGFAGLAIGIILLAL